MKPHIHTYMYTYTHIHSFIYICTYVSTCIYICSNMCVCICICIYIHTQANTYDIHLCMHIHKYIYTCVHMYICRGINIHTYEELHAYIRTLQPTLHRYVCMHTSMYMKLPVGFFDDCNADIRTPSSRSETSQGRGNVPIAACWDAGTLPGSAHGSQELPKALNQGIVKSMHKRRLLVLGLVYIR